MESAPTVGPASLRGGHRRRAPQTVPGRGPSGRAPAMPRGNQAAAGRS
jgi:hypothetical protein